MRNVSVKVRAVCGESEREEGTCKEVVDELLDEFLVIGVDGVEALNVVCRLDHHGILAHIRKRLGKGEIKEGKKGIEDTAKRQGD